MPSILDSVFWSIFNRFLLPTSTPESQLNASRLAFSWFSAFKVDIDFWSHFGTNLAPFWDEKSTKIDHKSTPRGIKKTIDFCIDFLSIFDRFWKPTWGHVGHSFGSKGGGLWPGALFYVALLFSTDFFRKFGTRGRWGTPFLAPYSDGVPHFWWLFGVSLVPTWRHLNPLCLIFFE